MNELQTKPCRPAQPDECRYNTNCETCVVCEKDQGRIIWSWVFDMSGCILASDGAAPFTGHLDEDLIGSWTMDLVQPIPGAPRLFGRDDPFRPLTTRQRIRNKKGDLVEFHYVALPIICQRTGELKGYRGAAEYLRTIDESDEDFYL